MIAKLFQAGADVFRINMSHTTPTACATLVSNIRTGRDSVTTGRSAFWSICKAQSCGRRIQERRPSMPEERTQRFMLDSDKAPGDATRVSSAASGNSAALCSRAHLLPRRRQDPAGDHRGRPSGKATHAGRSWRQASARKGVSLPDTTITFTGLMPKDRTDLEAALDARTSTGSHCRSSSARKTLRKRKRSPAAAPP